jgi:hypothetical protein
MSFCRAAISRNGSQRTSVAIVSFLLCFERD